MKVIISDNYGRDFIPDRLYRQNLTDSEARMMATDRNREDVYGPEYYRAVPDDHELFDSNHNNLDVTVCIKCRNQS